MKQKKQKHREANKRIQKAKQLLNNIKHAENRRLSAWHLIKNKGDI